MSVGMQKGIKYSQDQSSIMLLFEHNFRHNAIVLRVTLKSIRLKFSSIMYLTLPTTGLGVNTNFLCRIPYQFSKSEDVGD